MAGLNYSQSVKCVSCEKWMRLAELPAHIAREHVGYFPYRCLADGCGLKATTDDFGLLLLHRIETKHHYAVKIRPGMERLIADMLRICVEEAGKGRLGPKLEPGIKEEREVIEILDIDDTEELSTMPVLTVGSAPVLTQTTPTIGASRRGRGKEPTTHLDTVPSPGGPRFVAKKAKKSGTPTPRQSATPSVVEIKGSGAKKMKKAAVATGGSGAKKPRRESARRKKEAVAVSTAREMPNPPNTPHRAQSTEQSGGDGGPIQPQLTPSPPRRKKLDPIQLLAQPPPTPTEVGMGKKRKAPEENGLEAPNEDCTEDGTKRRKRVWTVLRPAVRPAEAPLANNNGQTGPGGGLNGMFSRVRQRTVAQHPIYNAYQLWMVENFGRMFAEGDGDVANGQTEAISQWTRLKDKSKWERKAEELAAARRKKANN